MTSRLSSQLCQRLRLSALLGLIAISCSPSGESSFEAETSEMPVKLQLIERIDHLDTLAREPMVVRHGSGTLFVSGYPSQVTGTDWTAPPLLWRSDDDGDTWQRVNVGSSADGAQGNSDVDLAVGPDGTVYFISMGFNRATREGTQIAVGVSHDAGANWQWHRLSDSRFADRPWISAAPHGIAHAIWNDDRGVAYSISRDSGRTWTEQPRIHDSGGSSHMAVGPGGEIAVRISPIAASANKFDGDTDLIAISRDNGDSWQKYAAPGKISWDAALSDPSATDPSAVPRWVEPLAWGPNRTLYHLWSEGDSVMLGWSRDFGQSWQQQIVSQDAGMAFFPIMVAGESGEIAATWFVITGDSLTCRLVLIRPGAGNDSELEVFQADPFTSLAWEETTDNHAPTPAGEYFPVVFLPNNELGVVTTIQDIHNARWGFSWWRFRLQ